MLLNVRMTVQQLAYCVAGCFRMASVVVQCISTATIMPAYLILLST